QAEALIYCGLVQANALNGGKCHTSRARQPLERFKHEALGSVLTVSSHLFVLKNLMNPLISDDPINASEHRDFEQHSPEALDQRSQARLRHHRDKFVEHGSLAKQRMRAFFGGV